MSETIDDLEVEFPKTVTACHAEIARLDGKIAELQEKNSELASKLNTASDRLAEIENDDEEEELGVSGAINAFLDECERTGPLRYDVPQTDRAMRAIVALHDAVGRNP
jgi:predicted  nucleic acid-binding Zn-ribbon protein